MRKRSVLLLPAAFALTLASGGCGGTNSETPWPVPPDDVDLGPEGEARRDEELSRPSRRAPRRDDGVAAPTASPPADPPPAASPPAADPAPTGSPATQF